MCVSTSTIFFWYDASSFGRLLYQTGKTAYLRNALKTTYLLVRIPQPALPCFSASAAYFTYVITPPNPRQLGEAFLPDSTPSRLCRICFRTFCFNHPFFTENEEKRGKYPLFLSFVWIAKLLFV